MKKWIIVELQVAYVIGGSGERDAIDGEEDVADGQFSSLPGGSVDEDLLDAD